MAASDRSAPALEEPRGEPYGQLQSNTRRREGPTITSEMPVGQAAHAKVQICEADLLASGRPRDPGACRHGALLSQSSVA